MRVLAILLALLACGALLSGCEVMYDIAQDSAMKDCDRIVDTPARNECVKRNRKPYDAYEKDRQQLKK
jgi:cytochrome c556